MLRAMKQLLIAYDGSPPAQRALAHGADLARPGDAVSVINVMPEPGVGARIEPPSEERNRQWSLLGEAQRFLAGRGIDADTVSAVGDVATEILTAAQRIGADVIVVARHRRHAPHLLGSVSGRVVRSARCDVLVVHEAPTERATARPGEAGSR
jgi:nucleotide-binding universal stress UspA family protein